MRKLGNTSGWLWLAAVALLMSHPEAASAQLGGFTIPGLKDTKLPQLPQEKWFTKAWIALLVTVEMPSRIPR